MTLQELSDAWNMLRNAALGRGTKPLVSDELADEVANEYSQFRRWLSDQGSLGDIVPSVTGAHWVELHRELAARVRAQGQWAPTVVRTPFERGVDAVKDTTEAVRDAATMPAAGMLVLGAGALGLAWALLRGRM